MYVNPTPSASETSVDVHQRKITVTAAIGFQFESGARVGRGKSLTQ